MMNDDDAVRLAHGGTVSRTRLTFEFKDDFRFLLLRVLFIQFRLVC